MGGDFAPQATVSGALLALGELDASHTIQLVGPTAAIATLFPTAKKPVVVLDSGANVDCGAAELVQFAQLGAIYAEDILGRDNPAVGLLSIGEEPEKGNVAVKEAHQLLESAGLNFI